MSRLPSCTSADVIRVLERAGWQCRNAIEDTSLYDIERAHLEVDGATVLLWIDVPPAIWKAFGG